jgi:dTDP-4-amino-4,6-dideoxygalactose transaminase
LKKIPFLSLAPQHEIMRTEILEAMSRVYEKNSFVLGSELESFEREFAAFTGTKFCLGVGNGFDALTIALKSRLLQSTDEVIVPANTYIATWLAVSHVGARIIPVEPDPATFNIDPSRIENAITSRTKIILPVHLFGQPCDMTAICQLAQKNALTIIEDNAQAHGGKWDSQLTGSFGLVNAISFYPTKNLGALGDAGAITSSDEATTDFIKKYRNYGFEKKNLSVEVGVNSRLDEMQAAALRIKLRYLNRWNSERQKQASIYLQNLEKVGDILLPVTALQAQHVYHLFVIRTKQRDQLKNYLAAKGIETMVHYPVPPHLQKSYAGSYYKKGDFPITEQMADTMLSLPLWPGLPAGDIEYISFAIKNFFSR